jgi:osmotically-inducible protein OsmY/sporulation protein YlmC with PRC-barrel domain
MKTFDFNIGAQVYCGEEACGELLKVVVDPHKERVTDLIVQRGLLFKTDRVLPVSAVERTTGQDIYLSVSSDEVKDYPEYREVDFKKPAPGWGQTRQYKAEHTRCWTSPWGPACQEPVVPMVRQRVHENVPSTSEVIERGTPVLNVMGEIGKVDHVLVDRESGEITHLVVRKGLIPEHPIVPASAIERVSEEGVAIDVTKEALEELPQYTPRSEEEILTELEERLEALSYDFGNVKAALEDGVMRLMGSVTDVGSKRRAEATARSVEGVIDVENELRVDAAVTAHVTAALADDPMTAMAIIDVINEQGLVTLKGRVDSVEVRDAAKEIAEKQPGVVSVVNALQVEPDEDTPSLAPWFVRRPPT